MPVPHAEDVGVPGAKRPKFRRGDMRDSPSVVWLRKYPVSLSRAETRVNGWMLVKWTNHNQRALLRTFSLWCLCVKV